jgi:hypothetical protein
MKKFFPTRTWAALAAATALAITLTACHTTKAHTFNVWTGDAVQIELNTSTGIDLTENDGSFAINKGNETIANGVFITSIQKNSYTAAIQGDPDAEVTSNTDDVFAWTYDDGKSDVEHNRILSINGTDKTYVMLVSDIENEADINAAYNAISASLDDK